LGACDGGTAPEEEALPTEFISSGYLSLPGCDPEADPNIEGAKRDSLAASIGDDVWAEASRVVPGGWGGWFFEDGRKKTYLVEPDSAQAAFAALHALGVAELAGAEVIQGLWSFAQLHDWRLYIRARQIYGIISSDNDEYRNRVSYGILEDEFDDTVAELAALGIPCDLVLVRTAAIHSVGLAATAPTGR
jgi:hypothetical protein